MHVMFQTPDFAAGGNDWVRAVEKRAAEENNKTI